MSDVHYHVKSTDIGGYKAQGSLAIVAPGALQAVAAKSKKRKIRQKSFCRLAAADCACPSVRRGQRVGKRGYKLSTETGQVHGQVLPRRIRDDGDTPKFLGMGNRFNTVIVGT